jgi:hypothetical protein
LGVSPFFGADLGLKKTFGVSVQTTPYFVMSFLPLCSIIILSVLCSGPLLPTLPAECEHLSDFFDSGITAELPIRTL